MSLACFWRRLISMRSFCNFAFCLASGSLRFVLFLMAFLYSELFLMLVHSFKSLTKSFAFKNEG